ncbi:MAG: biotin--[acetyl-CoA-carboxylase] ligase [Mycobacteriales bacterium]
MTEDLLTQEVVSAALGDRAVRAYPACLATDTVAAAWAREGAPSGAVVVADYQASPRGRGGLPWTVQKGRDLGFTLLTRPVLAPEREGWPYIPALLALHDVVGTRDGKLEWPDLVLGPDGAVVARLGVYVELGPSRTEWLAITVLVENAPQPRAQLLARLADTLEARLDAPPGQVLSDYIARCTTIGQRRRALLIPMGAGGVGGPEITGEGVDVLADGALVVLTDRGNRVAIPPHNLGLLEYPVGLIAPPEELFGHSTDLPLPLPPPE